MTIFWTQRMVHISSLKTKNDKTPAYWYVRQYSRGSIYLSFKMLLDIYLLSDS